MRHAPEMSADLELNGLDFGLATVISSDPGPELSLDHRVQTGNMLKWFPLYLKIVSQ